MANNFSGDDNCKALWRFENGALVVDSKGGNTLTTSTTPSADTVDFKEGASCVDYERDDGDGHYIADSNLDAGYPMKNGDATKSISVCWWMKAESTTIAYHVIYSKADNGKNNMELSVTSAGAIAMLIGTGGGTSWEIVTHASNTVDGQWYHVCCTFKDSDKSYRIRIWDDNAGTILGVDKAGTATNNINVEDATVRIAHTWAGNNYDGRIDEMVVFDDILAVEEIDQIRLGTYSPSSGVAAKIHHYKQAGSL
jgi:hypothetical protein